MGSSMDRTHEELGEQCKKANTCCCSTCEHKAVAERLRKYVQAHSEKQRNEDWG